VYKFVLEYDCTDAEVLDSLIASVPYADAYLSPEPMPTIEGISVHGPYILSSLNAESFRRVDLAAARRLVVGFLARGTPPRTSTELDLDEAVMEPIHRAEAAFLLHPGPSAEHDLSWMLGDFTELVVVSRASRQLLDVVMGFD
jgi:hypothetical protein